MYATSVDFTSKFTMGVSRTPFIDVGYLEVQSGERPDYRTTPSISSSLSYYPHILKLQDDYMFLPLQGTSGSPASYDGATYFGRLNTTCRPAEFSGDIVIGENPDGPGLVNITGSITPDFADYPFITPIAIFPLVNLPPLQRPNTTSPSFQMVHRICWQGSQCPEDSFQKVYFFAIFNIRYFLSPHYTQIE